MPPDILGWIMNDSKVADVRELPDDMLRLFCRMAMPRAMERQFERMEEKHPGQVGMVVGHDSNGNEVVLQSGDVGFDVLKRMAAPIDPAEELLCNPDYSPVDLELRVVDELAGETDELGHDIGVLVLKTTVQPPNLA